MPYPGAIITSLESRSILATASLWVSRCSFTSWISPSFLGDVVCTHHKADVNLRHVILHLIHLQNPLIGNTCFCEQHVHLTRHAPGDWMDGEARVDTLVHESICDVGNCTPM